MPKREFIGLSFAGILTLFGLLYGEIAVAQGPPQPLVGVLVSGTVKVNSTTKIYTYAYKITNPPTNSGDIYSIEIDLTQLPTEMVLSRTGLVNGPNFALHGSETTFSKGLVVPVGVDGPNGWTYALGESEDATHGFGSWGALEGFNITPGSSLEGFVLTSPAPPGIRSTEVRPWIDPKHFPPDTSDWSVLDKFLSQFTFRASTVGPKAPPQSFVPLEFMNYLITLVHDSRQQGWIKVEGVHKSLLAKLTNAKRKLEAGDNKVAKNMLNAFLNEVQATSCPNFTCPGNKPLTSEAYALLFFNGQYLWERL